MFVMLTKVAFLIGRFDHGHARIWLCTAIGIFAVGAICAAIGIAGKTIKKAPILLNTHSEIEPLIPEQINPISEPAIELEKDAPPAPSNNIYIFKSGKRVGPFTQNQIEEMIKAKFI